MTTLPTLKVNTIQNTSGGSSSTPAQIASGLAKAWISYNGSTSSIRSSYNVSSVTDNATADFTINFTFPIGNANYSWTGTVMSTESILYKNLTLANGYQNNAPITRTSHALRGIQLHRNTTFTAAYTAASTIETQRWVEPILPLANIFPGYWVTEYTTVYTYYPDSAVHNSITAPSSTNIRVQVTDSYYNNRGGNGWGDDAEYVNLVVY